MNDVNPSLLHLLELALAPRALLFFSCLVGGTELRLLLIDIYL